jgi:hypothetical protein
MNKGKLDWVLLFAILKVMWWQLEAEKFHSLIKWTLWKPSQPARLLLWPEICG